MGTDIYQNSGVLCGIDDIVKFINGKNKKIVIEICTEFYDNLKSEAEGKDTDSSCSNRFKHFEPLAAFRSNTKMTISDVREVAASVVKVSGEPAKYDLDTHVVQSEEVLELFGKIVDSYRDATSIDIPLLEEVNAWGSSRYNGWDVPIGEACFVFNEDECYTKQVSDEGKNLKKVIGHCDVTEWTTYSC